MKNTTAHPVTHYRVLLVCLCLSLLAPIESRSQLVSTGYFFNSSQQTYRPDTSTLATPALFPTFWDDNTYIGYTFPFNFTYRGVLYTAGTSAIGVDTDGWMAFSQTSTITMTGTVMGGSWVSASNSQGVYLNGTANNNGFCGFNSDLKETEYPTITGNTVNGSNWITSLSSLTDLRVGMRITGNGITSNSVINFIDTVRFQVRLSAPLTATATGVAFTPRSGVYGFLRGIAPFRQFVIQWTRCSRFSGPQGDDFTFQMVLNEGGGIAAYQTLQAVYGVCFSTNVNPHNVQAGLRGNTASDFNARRTTGTNNWSNSVAATKNSDTLVVSPTQNPPSGLTYTWAPQCLAAPQNPGTISGPTVVCPGTSVNYTIPGVIGAIRYDWTYTGNNTTFSGSTTLPLNILTFGLNATGSGVLTVSAFNLCGVSQVNSSITINVNALPTASISYTPSTICRSGAAVSVTRVGGTNGGRYFAAPPGLRVDSLTGTITPAASIPGTYTVTYYFGSLLGGCPGQGSTQVRIEDTLLVSTTATPNLVCNGGNTQLQASVVSNANYSVSAIPYTSLSNAARTVLWNTYTDDAISAGIPIPFTFQYYGQPVSQLFVSSNGHIQLDYGAAPFSANTEQLIPNPATPNNVVALCWDDLMVDPTVIPGSEVSYFIHGTAPNRVMVIQYQNLYFFGGTSAQNVTGQIRLYESDWHIEVAAQQINDNGEGRTKTLGIENSAGTLAAAPAGRNLASFTCANEAWSFQQPSNALTYAWTPANYLNNTSIPNPLATGVVNNITYSLTVSSAGGCVSRSSVSVTAGTPGAAGPITGPTPICRNTTQTYSLTALNFATSYTWTYSGTGATFTASTSTPTVSITFSSTATTGTLTVAGVNACGSGATSALNIAFTNTTAATLSYTPSALCISQAGTVSPTLTPLGISGSYSVNPVTGLSINTSTGAITPSTSALGTYLVTFTYLSNGCTLTTSRSVSISQAPTITASANPSQICTGGTSQLQATASFGGTYTVTGIPHTMAVPTGTTVTVFNSLVDDQITAAYSLPFPFTFYGNAVTQFYICSNGYIQFGNNPLQSLAEQFLPNPTTPNDLVALCWDDLVVDPSTNVGAQVRYFVNGAAPNRMLVVDYVNLRFIGGGVSAQNVTGQIRLYEADSHIEVAVATVNDNATNRTKTLGIENAAGTQGLSPAGRNLAVWNVTNESWSFNPVVNNFTYAWTPAAQLNNASISNPLTVPLNANTTFTVTATPVGGGCAASTTVPVTPSAPMSGTYTVGPAGNYVTLTSAVNDYNTRCINGPVTFLLTGTTYSASETFPITIRKNIYQSALNTLTIKPGAGVNALISGSVANNAVLRITGDYIFLNGTNGAGTVSRNLTLENTSLTTPTVLLVGSGGTTAVSNVSVLNTILRNGALTSTTLVVSDSATAGNAGYFRNIVIQNDSIVKGFMGIYCHAAVATGNGRGLTLSGNMLNSSGVNAIQDNGIYVQGVDSAFILNNVIGNFTGSNAYADRGIWVARDSRNTLVSGNRISNINYTGTGGWGAYGIYVSTVRANANITLQNNMVANISSDGSSLINTTNTFQNPTGILLLTAQSGINVHHNSVHLYGNTLNKNNAVSVCLRLDTASNADIRNNILVNKLGRLATGVTTGNEAYCIYAPTSASQFTQLNFNNYFIAPGANVTAYVGRLAGAGSATLAVWQTLSGRDQNSTNVDPVFTSATDLHLANTNLTLSNTGTGLSTSPTDIDNQTRNGSNPDVGCDEWLEPNRGSWVGRVSTDWLVPENWEGNVVPNGTTDVFINGGYTFMPRIITTQAVRDINFAAPNAANIPVLTLDNGILQINRNMSRTAGGIDAVNGTVQLNGTGTQTIPPSLFIGNNLRNLVIGNTHNSATGGVGIGGALNILRSVTFSQPSTVFQRLNMGVSGNLTFKSTATETAWMGKVTGKTIVGQAIVERYIPTGINHGKSWQLLSVPVKGTQTIKQAWQENAAPNTNPVAGFGTQITSNLGGSVTGARALGFDTYSPAGPSLKVYDAATDTYIGVSSTNIPIPNKKGYMVFVRGSRSDTALSSPPTSTVLRTKGNLFTTGADAPPIDTVPAGRFQSIGNPYVSAIDFTQLIYDGPPGIDNAFYVWDPTLYGFYGLGALQTLSGANDFKPVPGGTSYYPTGVRNTRIQSGQAFFMKGGPVGGSVTFTEDAKVDSSRLVHRAPEVSASTSSTKMFLHARILAQVGGAFVMADGATTVLQQGFANDIDGYDAVKMANNGENFGIQLSDKTLAVEARNDFTVNDTVFYRMSNLRSGVTYKLLVYGEQWAGFSLQPILIDRFLNQSVPVPMTDTLAYDFQIQSGVALSQTNRFILVFRPSQPLPVRFVKLEGQRKSAERVDLSWTVAQEEGVLRYELERSLDARTFLTVHTERLVRNQPSSLITYRYADEQASAGALFYRVKGWSVDGSVQQSAMIRVGGWEALAGVQVSPNPIQGRSIRIKVQGLEFGSHPYQLMDMTGRTLQTGVLSILGSAPQWFTVDTDQKFPQGQYILKIIAPSEKEYNELIAIE